MPPTTMDSTNPCQTNSTEGKTICMKLCQTTLCNKDDLRYVVVLRGFFSIF